MLCLLRLLCVQRCGTPQPANGATAPPPNFSRPAQHVNSTPPCPHSTSLLPPPQVSLINLNDGTCAGMLHPGLKAMTVQSHPEASPGPHDSDVAFEQVRALLLTAGDRWWTCMGRSTAACRRPVLQGLGFAGTAWLFEEKVEPCIACIARLACQPPMQPARQPTRPLPPPPACRSSLASWLRPASERLQPSCSRAPATLPFHLSDTCYHGGSLPSASREPTREPAAPLYTLLLTRSPVLPLLLLPLPSLCTP